jgi:hypothetical protein
VVVAAGATTVAITLVVTVIVVIIVLVTDVVEPSLVISGFTSLLRF